MDSKSILNKVIETSESIFSNIAENYPLLLDELEKDIESASESIDSFTTLEGLSKEDGDIKLSAFLNQSKSRFDESLLKFDSFKVRNEEMLNKLSDAMKSYRHSIKYIDEIRDISESLQIVSLNALCNAVKAGKGGEGFSVITGDLKNVTESTIEKTSNLEKKGTSVQSALDEFIVIEEETGTNRKKLFSLLEGKVIKSVSTFKAESETIDKLFRELTSESGDIRACILRIMEELQQQDLIRQTIDQVLLSLDELPDHCENCDFHLDSEEDVVDKTVFCRRLINLAVVMIEDVEQKIGSTISKFSDNFKTARRKLEFIQSEKERAVTKFMENIADVNELSELGKDIQRAGMVLSSTRSSLIDLIGTVIELVAGIVEEFASFNKISGWLQNVAVLSRIELSRSNQLAGMRESVDDMSKLVERIQQQISEGEKETLTFIGNIGGVSDEYKEFATQEMSFLSEFTNIFMANISKINSINNNITRVLSDFDFFSGEFCELFDESEKDLDQLKEMLENLRSVREDLISKETRIDSILTERLNGRSISDWTIKDDDMNHIIDKFTIYSHKKTAGDAGGFNVEEAILDEGEITLF